MARNPFGLSDEEVTHLNTEMPPYHVASKTPPPLAEYTFRILNGPIPKEAVKCIVVEDAFDREVARIQAIATLNQYCADHGLTPPASWELKLELN